MTRRRWLIAGYLVALGAVATWQGPVLYFLVRYEERWTNGRGAYEFRPEGVIQRETRDRWGPSFPCRWTSWSVETGYTFSTGSLVGETFQATAWEPGGSVSVQFIIGFGGGSEKVQESPPWRWGATDQTAPNAPWVAEGISAEEFWERVKSE